MSPLLADLFSGAGGAAAGYHAAGFEVIGFDIEPMPNYPYEHHVADALEVDLAGFDAVHASPPCQAFTKYRNTGNVGEYPDLIDATRRKLTEWGGPWVMENVEGAPLADPVLVCGTMFDPPMEVQRHRLFEANWPLSPPVWPCRHKLNGPNRYPGGRSKIDHGDSRALCRRTIEIGAWRIPKAKQQEAMGIDWMTLPELSESIPPAYTRHIGAQLLSYLEAKVA